MNAPLTRVLVVDDDPDLAVQIRSMLRKSPWSYEVQAESGGSDLHRRLSRREFDVWILDHHLSEKVGSELLASLPPDVERPPFVVLTMSLDPVLSQTYLALGAADFLNKDELRPALLERTLRYAIAHDDNRRNLDRQQEQLLRSERIATIGRIAAGVAHEYNNHHAVALGSLERLQRRLGGDPASERLLVRITESIQSSRRISESLFKLGQGNGLNGAITDLQARIHDFLSLLQHQATKAGVKIEFSGIQGQAPVEMDGSDVHLVLSHPIPSHHQQHPRGTHRPDITHPCPAAAVGHAGGSDGDGQRRWYRARGSAARVLAVLLAQGAARPRRTLSRRRSRHRTWLGRVSIRD